MTHSLIHRLQKWLIQEPFEMHYDPKARPPFKVALGGDGGVLKFEGQGFSISQAAKLALHTREAFLADLTLAPKSDVRTDPGENP